MFNNFFKKCNRNLTFKSFSYFSLNPLKKYWKLTKVKKVHVHKWWLDIFYVPKSILVYTFPPSYNNMYKLTFTNANNFKTDYVINNNVMICDLFCNDMWSILYIIMFWKALVWGFFWSMLIEYPISNNLRLKIVWQLLCMQRFLSINSRKCHNFCTGT